MQNQNPDTEYFFILGADSLYDFEKSEENLSAFECLYNSVATRNHTSHQRLDETIAALKKKYGGRIEKLNSLNIDISSEQIRTWIQQRRSLAYYVPD